MVNGSRWIIGSDIDPRLIEEAFRRARAARGNESKDSNVLLTAILAEARAGGRDIYTLVRATYKAESVKAA